MTEDDDTHAQDDADRASYCGTPMDHVTDAMAYMVAGMAGKSDAHEMAMRQARLYGRGIVAVMTDSLGEMKARFIDISEGYDIADIGMDIFENESFAISQDMIERIRVKQATVDWPMIPMDPRERDHGHPRSPKSSRRKGHGRTYQSRASRR